MTNFENYGKVLRMHRVFCRTSLSDLHLDAFTMREGWPQVTFDSNAEIPQISVLLWPDLYASAKLTPPELKHGVPNIAPHILGQPHWTGICERHQVLFTGWCWAVCGSACLIFNQSDWFERADGGRSNRKGCSNVGCNIFPHRELLGVKLLFCLWTRGRYLTYGNHWGNVNLA